MRYWLFVDEAMLGPYEADQLRGVSRFSPETLVCPEGAVGGSDWVPARTRSELAEIFTRPASSPFAPQRQPAPLEVVKPGEICLRCRNQAPADSLFCNKCGMSLKPSPKAAEKPVFQEPAPAMKAASIAPAPIEKSSPPLVATPPKPEPGAMAKVKHWLVPLFVAGTAFSAMIFVLPRILPKKTVEMESPAPIAAPVVENTVKEEAPVVPPPQSLAMVKPPAEKIALSPVSPVPTVKKSTRRPRRAVRPPEPVVEKAAPEPSTANSEEETDDQLDKLLNAGKPAPAQEPDPAAKEEVKEISMLPGLSRPAAATPKCSAATLLASYTSDSGWYYGAGQSSDVKKSRALALVDLSKQVAASIADSMDEAEIDQIAGPGQDWEEVAKHVGAMLPASRILAEQTEERHQTCDGQSVVGARIEKHILLRYVKENKDFKAALAKKLSKK